MAENKKPFEDEFNTDEFDAFDNDDFHFDDEDDDPFQLDISEDDTENMEGEESPYSFSEDDSEESDEEESESHEEEKRTEQSKFNSTLLLHNLIERLKNEEPKQLIKYGIGAFFVLLFLIGGLIKLISPAPKTTKTAPTQANTLLNQSATQGTTNIPTLSSNSTTSGFTTANSSNGNASNEAQNSANSLESLNAPTPVNIPQPVATNTSGNSAPQSVSAVVNPAEMQQAATQNSTLTNHINQLDAQVAQLTQQVTVDAQMNASNQAQIATLIKSIDGMQSQMAKINNAMQTIVSAVGQSGSRQSGFVAGDNNFNNTPAMQTAPDYYVQAVIPGRAWLKSSNGQILTVTRGDAIPGYGTVDNIDSQNGIVTTSTGTKIAFGIDEG